MFLNRSKSTIKKNYFITGNTVIVIKTLKVWVFLILEV